MQPVALSADVDAGLVGVQVLGAGGGVSWLDVRLQDLRLRVDRAKAQAGLLFLRPERNVLLVPDEGANP